MGARRVLLVAFLLCLNGLSKSVEATGEVWNLSTDDTEIAVSVVNNQPVVNRLADVGQGHNWIDQAVSVPLMARVGVDDREVRTTWLFQKGTLDKKSGTLTLVFRNARPRLVLRSIWRAQSGRGPVEYWVEIENLSGKLVTLFHQESLVLDTLSPAGPTTLWAAQRGGEAGGLGQLYTVPLDKHFEMRLECEVGRAPLPWLAAQVREDHGLYVGWEFSAGGRIAAKARQQGDGLAIRVGLDPEFKTDLKPGETFLVPPAFVGCYRGDLEEGSYSLHRYCIEKLRRPVPRGFPDPCCVYGVFFDCENEAQLLEHAKIAQKCGFEVVVVDAIWFEAVGDWRWNKGRFPRGSAPLKAYLQEHDMRLGGWFAWALGGVSTFPDALNVHLNADLFPGDLPADFPPPVHCHGPPMCLGSEAARDRAIGALKQVIDRDGLQFVKDDGRYIVSKCAREEHRHHYETDVSYWATMGYYEVREAILEAFPNLVWEGHSWGGRINDFGALRRSHYLTTKHPRTTLSNRVATYDTTLALPPAVLIVYTGGPWAKYENGSAGDPSYVLRSAMLSNWVFGPHDSVSSPQWRESLTRSVGLFKTWLGPVMRDCKVFRVLPRPDGKHWDGLFYWNAGIKKGTLYVFRPDSDVGSKIVKLRGLKPEKKYWLWCEDGSIEPGQRSGAELMQQGIKIALPDRYTSDLIFVQDAQLGRPPALVWARLSKFDGALVCANGSH